MAKSFNKTYSITLKFTYEDNADIADDDLHAEELREKIKGWIDGKVAQVQQGNLSVHVVGEVSEV